MLGAGFDFGVAVAWRLLGFEGCGAIGVASLLGGVVLAIAGDVTVLFLAVVVVGAVAVAATARTGAVDNHSQQRCVVVAKYLAGALDQVAVVLLDANHHQTTIADIGNNGGIGHGQQRRGIDQHDVELRAGCGNELRKSLGLEQLRGM